jgi:hypothetical protein
MSRRFPTRDQAATHADLQVLAWRLRLPDAFKKVGYGLNFPDRAVQYLKLLLFGKHNFGVCTPPAGPPAAFPFALSVAAIRSVLIVADELAAQGSPLVLASGAPASRRGSSVSSAAAAPVAGDTHANSSSSSSGGGAGAPATGCDITGIKRKRCAQPLDSSCEVDASSGSAAGSSAPHGSSDSRVAGSNPSSGSALPVARKRKRAAATREHDIDGFSSAAAGPAAGAVLASGALLPLAASCPDGELPVSEANGCYEE